MKQSKTFRILSMLLLLIALLTPQTGALASNTSQGTGPTAVLHPDGVTPAADPSPIDKGDTITFAIDLNNIPDGGLTSIEFGCYYDPALVSISSLSDGGLFGADAISTTNGPDGGTFVFAVAGVSQKATSSGVVFRFDITALETGSFAFECRVRASTGSDLFTITFVPTTITIVPAATDGTITGVVTAGKEVTVVLKNGGIPVATTVPAGDGSFTFVVPAGTYTIEATASGFLMLTRVAFVLAAGDTVTLPTESLLAGDITGDDAIDASDVFAIGLNYMRSTPTAADLNNSGIIDILDLQLLAPNYPQAGPSTW